MLRGNSYMQNEETKILNEWKNEHDEKIFFLTLDLGAEIHWFFTQALEAMKQSLYLPACSCFINGIEASIRITYAKQTSSSTNDLNALTSIPTLSNNLLKNAQMINMPVNSLKFPNENNFEANLDSKKPDLKHVEIVRVRHNLAHGNIFEYINSELGDDNLLFTPECCRELAEILYAISKDWCMQLSEFKKDNI